MNLQSLRFIGIAEGVSFLLLLGVCMPLKYIWTIPEPTFVIGMAHGILFLMYCLLVVFVGYGYKWPLATFIWAFLAALLPFGTFVADKQIFSKYR